MSMTRLVVRTVKLVRALSRPPARPFAIRRILVIHNLLLGDTILLAPLLKALALRYPAAERVVLARPGYAVLFEGKPYGASVLEFDRREAASQMRVMRSGPYDLAFVVDDNRYGWLARASGASWIIGFAGDRPAWKNHLIDQPVPYSNEPHAWADMAAGLTSLPDLPGFQPGEWPQPRAPQFDRPGGPYAVLHVGASSPLKLWPAPRWRRLADALSARGLAVVWSAGRGEGGVLDAIGVAPGEACFVGSLDLAGLWALLDEAALLVCPDTGIAHLARIVSVPTVALFGPGSAVVHGPGEFWSDAPFWVVTDPHYPCRDQTILFRREVSWVARCGRGFGNEPGQCPRAGCMEVLAFEKVWEAVDAALGAGG